MIAEPVGVASMSPSLYSVPVVPPSTTSTGNALVTKTPTTIAGLKHNITLTETHIFIGCEGHTIKHWEKEIKNIGKKHNYTDKEIEGTILMLKGALMQRGY
jgi:hypothetical protein